MALNGERLTPTRDAARLVAFDTESDKSNLALIDAVCAYLDGWGVPFAVSPMQAGTKAAILASLRPSSEGGIVLSGHTDVVPVAGQPAVEIGPLHSLRVAGHAAGPTGAARST